MNEPAASPTPEDVIAVLSGFIGLRARDVGQHGLGFHAHVDRTKNGEQAEHEVWVFPFQRVWEVYTPAWDDRVLFSPDDGRRSVRRGTVEELPPVRGEEPGIPLMPVQMFLPGEMWIWGGPYGTWRTAGVRRVDGGIALDLVTVADLPYRASVELVEDGYARRFETPIELVVVRDVERLTYRDYRWAKAGH